MFSPTKKRNSPIWRDREDILDKSMEFLRILESKDAVHRPLEEPLSGASMSGHHPPALGQARSLDLIHVQYLPRVDQARTE